MLWYSMITPPERDGIYYVRNSTKVDSSDLRNRGSKLYWDINTYAFTTTGGWNTHIDYDGSIQAQNKIVFGESAEWSEVDYVDD